MTSQSPKRTNADTEFTPEEKQNSEELVKRRKLSSSPEVAKNSEKTFDHSIDEDLIFRAIKNFNDAKNDLFPSQLNLEIIYTEKSFKVYENVSSTNKSIDYDSKDVNHPRDNNGNLLSSTIINVFSKSINCIYFNKEELERIFSILKLSPEAQSLLARMLKRKRGWHKVEAIKYPDLAANLKPVFKELVNKNFFHEDTKNESPTVLLNLLQVDEIRNICKTMKVNHKGTKSKLITELAKLSDKKKSLFPGMKTPSSALTAKIIEAIGPCVRLNDDVENLLNRVFILLIPNQDPREKTVDIFRTLAEVKYGDKIFPPTPETRFPIFKDRKHLLDYTEAKEALTSLYNSNETKDWDKACSIGRLALIRLEPIFQKVGKEDEEELPLSMIPSYVKRFEVNYNWAKILWKSVEGFKKTKEGIEVAAEFLHSLIRHRKEYLGHPGRWYGELALIEMHHRKNLEASARITVEGLNREKLSEVEIGELSERARKLLSRSKNISSETKEKLTEATKIKKEEIPVTKPIENIIEATFVQGNTTGSKSTWSVGIGGTDIAYARVEQVALLHYSSKGFTKGLHCEGALPVTLFATFFWNEIYEIPVPGAFVSSYQEAPLDLYSSSFIDNRREEIEGKIRIMKEMNIEELSKILCEDFMEYRHYSSIMHGNLFEDPEDLKDFIACLGTKGIVGICERLAKNYNQWKSGFPDLVVWDSSKKKCKFVEVKGPGDSLSIKQKLWIQFLESLDVEVEVCIVKGTTKKY